MLNLIQMKSNLNAVHGAIQQVDKLIAISKKDGKVNAERKIRGAKHSDKLMKRNLRVL